MIVDRTANVVADAIGRSDAWFESMKASRGYTGPIPHWWESCLLYCGPMVDWRYEGILAGYVALWGSTGDARWLDRARAAADCVVGAQLPSGSFRNSSFQLGAIEGGTPHEAAVDVGLLELASALGRSGEDNQKYVLAAERNIDTFLIGRLWDGQGFRDQPTGNDTHVPNKNATTMEALILYETLVGRDMSEFIDASVLVVLSAQVRSGRRAGGTVHRGTGALQLAFAIYTARSMAGVMRAHARQPEDRLLAAVADALLFIDRLITDRGLLTGYYRDDTLIGNPTWIAATGDALRLAILGEAHGLTPSRMVQRLTDILVEQQLTSGAFPTGHGFAEKGRHRPYAGTPELRDVLPAVGWSDKAFRALAMLPGAAAASPGAVTRPVDIACVWQGDRLRYRESPTRIEFVNEADGQVRYGWDKRRTWPDVYAL